MFKVLFNKISEFRDSISKVLILLISLVGSAFVAFLTQIILGRMLTVDEFGVITASLSMVYIIASMIGFGLPNFWLQCFGNEGWQALRWINPCLKFLLVYTPCIFFLLWGYQYFLMANIEVSKAIVWFHSLILLQVLLELLFARYQLEGRYKLLSFWQAVPHLSRLLVAILGYSIGSNKVDFIVMGFSLVALFTDRKSVV